MKNKHIHFDKEAGDRETFSKSTKKQEIYHFSGRVGASVFVEYNFRSSFVIHATYILWLQNALGDLAMHARCLSRQNWENLLLLYRHTEPTKPIFLL